MTTLGAGDQFDDTIGSSPEELLRTSLLLLHDDLQALARRQLGMAEFKQRWPASQIIQWQRWQHSLQEAADASLDLSCLLAYYAVDYDANVTHLAQARDKLCQERDVSAPAETFQPLYCLPGHLSIVYRKQRDPALLFLLLELRMPCLTLRRTQWEIIAGLWDRHREALLHVVGQSPLAQQTLRRALIYVCQTVGEPTLWRAYYRHLQSITYLRDRLMTRAALRLITELRQAERRDRS